MFRADDLDLLLPSFKPYVVEVERAMLVRGYEAIPFDTWRSPKEALKFAARKVGRPDSMHIYRIACDHICAKHGWDCRRMRCAFYAVYGEEVERLHMVWGGRFKSKFDGPHMQGVALSDQDEFRALPSDEARDAFALARLCKPLPAGPQLVC